MTKILGSILVANRELQYTHLNKSHALIFGLRNKLYCNKTNKKKKYSRQEKVARVRPSTDFREIDPEAYNL